MIKMQKLIASETISGFALVRKIEDILFATTNTGGDFYWRAKLETTILTKDYWSGHNKEQVIDLAKEFGIEVEFV
jgi:hypothetical protein